MNSQSPLQYLSTAFKFSMFSVSLSRSLVLRVWTKDPWGLSRPSQWVVHEIKTIILIILSCQYLLSTKKKKKRFAFFTVLTFAPTVQKQWQGKTAGALTQHIKAKLSPRLYSYSLYLPLFTTGGKNHFHLRVSDKTVKMII